MKRSGWIKRYTKLKDSNPARQARRRKKMAKLRQTKESKAARQAALERAGGRCEYPQARIGMRLDDLPIRCTATENLECHHVHYQRAGNENPDDFLVLCKEHHHLIESRQRPYNRNRF